ncbi:MAG TPA: hypothetical protein VF584_18830 [Longimicrobium sp.]|jgi:hypothetical protein
MPTIEIRREEVPGQAARNVLLIDGASLENADLTATSRAQPAYMLLVRTKPDAEAVKRCSLADLVGFSNIRIFEDLAWINLGRLSRIEWEAPSERWRLYLSYRIDIRKWAGPYSIGSLREAVRDSLQAEPIRGLSFSTGNVIMGEGFGVTCLIRNPQTPIGEEIEFWEGLIRPVVEHAETCLSEDVERDTIVTLFDFPAPVKTACGQYLLYFAQFLKDLGIDADTDVRNRAGQILFSVRPRDGAEALDRVREALDTYLQLPDAPNLDSAVASTPNIAALQLQANVHHLKGQLAIASALVQAKDAQLEALQISNFQYRQMLGGSMEVNNLGMLPLGHSKPEPDPADEPLFGGLVSITPLEMKGINVNLPEIVRRLRRRVGDEG